MTEQLDLYKTTGSSPPVRLDILRVMLLETRRFRHPGRHERRGRFTLPALVEIMHNPAEWDPLKNRYTTKDPENFPLWNVGYGVGIPPRRTREGLDIPGEIFLPAPKSTYKKGRIPSDLDSTDLGGGFSTVTRIDPMAAERDLPWFAPKPGATDAERKQLAQLFFSTLWQRARHTKNPRASYDRWLLVAGKFWGDRMSAQMIADESYGELTVETVKSVIKRLKKPPEGWSYEEQMANFNNAH